MASFLSKIPKWMQNKFVIATVVFLLYMFLLDDNNVFNQYKLYKEEQNLQNESVNLKASIKELRKKNDDLQKNPLTIEKVAREKYGMKKDNETVFLVQ